LLIKSDTLIASAFPYLLVQLFTELLS